MAPLHTLRRATWDSLRYSECEAEWNDVVVASNWPAHIFHACSFLASVPHSNTHACRLNKQLHFTPVEYGIGSGMYFLGYGAAILPSTFMTLKLGAGRWMGLMTCVCGVVGMTHALMANREGFYVLRLLMGVAEAGGGSSTGHLLAQFWPKSRSVCVGWGVCVCKRWRWRQRHGRMQRR